MIRAANWLGLVLCVSFLISCGHGGATGQLEAPVSSITGTAIKGPVAGAQIQLYYFDGTGSQVEIAADNTPVITDSTGSFTFQVDGRKLMGITCPLLVRSSGGTMYGGAAPTLEGIIADPLPLSYDQVTVSCDLSAPSSVVAGLLKKLAHSIGFAPDLADAQLIIALVEDQLAVDISADPADDTTDLAMFNESIDQNLDLMNTPVNNPAVDELIQYFVANLRSSSGMLDETMESPSGPGVDTTADFTSWTGLDSLFPSGPSDLTIMILSSDKEFIENNGTDTAIVTAKLFNAKGKPSTSLAAVQLGLWSGPGSLNSMDLNYGTGQVQGELTCSQAGDNFVRAEFLLPNTNIIAQQVTVTAVDLVTDSDGDGFADGDEEMGWDITIDALGYGSDGAGRLLIMRHVTSDPTMQDTDADGLDDYLEYIIRTDPQSSDTDGDGLTDAEEWHRWMSSPTSVDTDGDARGPDRNLPPKPDLFDGNELFNLSTSPTLSDTDGDGWTDYEEFDHPSRSPRIADLPRLELSTEDDVDVRLNVAYAEQSGQTSQYGAVLTKSKTLTTSRYDSRTISHSLMVGSSYKLGLTGGLTVKSEYTFSNQQTVAFTTGSSRTAQAAYSRYNTEARTRTESAATGSMTMGIRLHNTGNITYTITQLGITARQWRAGAYDPADPEAVGTFTTIATLVPALGGGITLAPGSTSPVLQVQVSSVNADRIKNLLARPGSLRLEPAYYELENAEGLNFAYMEEITGPRTAMVFMDYGDGRTEEYRVAANVDRDSEGGYAGVTIGEIMNGILAIPYETRPRQVLEPGASTNERVLYKVRDLAADTVDIDKGFWTVILPDSTSSQSGLDFEDLTVYGGEQVLLVFVKDVDGDGLYAAEEQYYRTDDESALDTDGDGLTDTQEVRGGWTVVLPSQSYFVTSDPAEADQDGDDLNDLAEMILGTDPTLPDTDRDGLGDGYDPHPLHPARVLHVREGGSAIEDGLTWLTALNSLTEALVEARNGNATALTPEDDVAEVWVAAGRYVPSDTGDRGVSFELSPNISVYGGFSGVETKLAQRNDNPLSFPTTLSGDLLNNDAESYEADTTTFSDNSYHVAHADDTVDGTTLLDGFFIIGGNADNLLLTDGGKGGGMLSSGTPTLRHLFFRTNRANLGAGLFVEPTASEGLEMTVTNCFFNRNVAFYDASGGTGGGMYYSGPGSTLNITRCEFSENESWGSAGLALGTDLTANISETVFDRNDAQNWIVSYQQGIGGGAGIGTGSKVRINRCRFTRNKATYGGGMSAGLDIQVQINQTVFWENEAITPSTENYGGGGAIYTRGGSIWIVNSTIANNRAIDPDSTWAGVQFGRTGGIWFNGTGSHRIENSIIYGNTYSSNSGDTYPNIGVQQIMLSSSSTLTVLTSDIRGLALLGRSGNGNMDAGPAFTDGAVGNLNLSTGSPCLDAGSNYVDYEPMEPGFQLLPETDMAGNWRIVDGNGDGNAVVDMGPYEYQGD